MTKQTKELRKLTKDQLEERLAQVQFQLLKDRAQVAAGTAPKNSAGIATARKTIARINTLRND